MSFAQRITAAIALPVLVSGCGGTDHDNATTPESTAVVDRFLGSESCGTCHEAEYAAWQNSHHELAMQIADERSVLADFNDAALEYYGTSTQFRRDDANFVVRTPDQNGQAADFKVTHTFGIEPLQQYLVELPGGRLQALPFVWDTRPHDDGGQRWYHLYEDEYIAPGDPLHWTGRYLNWNVMCAECHSTNVRLGYDSANDTFDTRWDEISVGCEACHGPGARHVRQAELEEFDSAYGLPVNLDDAGTGAWVFDSATGIAALDSARERQQQPESCGRCHARRGVLTEDYEYDRPLTDTHMPSLLDEDLYFADGRILDEVYVYGSFLQSAMYRAGVTCTDCHDPHTAKLVTGPEPNAVCSQCHLPSVFATTEHSGTDADSCVDCHMASRTYMGVDDRRDHSFRLPETGPHHYGRWIEAGRAGEATNGELCNLINMRGEPPDPAIAKATLYTLLTPPFDPYDEGCIDAGLRDTDPIVRIGALRAVQNIAPERRLRYGTALLRDDVRGVRVEAARTFADLRDLLPLEDARAFAAAAEEYRTSLEISSSMPESATILSELQSRTSNERAARGWLAHALRIDPDFAPAVHARGLQRIREGLPDLALEDFRRAAELEPGVARYAFVLGVALNSVGLPDEAVSVLRDARERFPADFDIGWGLATILRDSGQFGEARAVTVEMLRTDPDNPNLNALMQSLDDRQ